MGSAVGEYVGDVLGSGVGASRLHDGALVGSFEGKLVGAADG